MSTSAPPWAWSWTRDAKTVETSGLYDRDEIRVLPSGHFSAELSNFEFTHGPHNTIEEARKCCGHSCDCWKPEVKEQQLALRRELAKRANSY